MLYNGRQHLLSSSSFLHLIKMAKENNAPLIVVLIVIIIAALAAIVAIVVSFNGKSCETESTPSTSVPPSTPASAQRSALFDYVEMPDPTYNYQILPDATLRGVSENDSSTTFILKMTSQTWLTPDKVSEAGNVWWHYLSITIPDTIVYEDSAIVFISGGDNTDSAPNKTDFDVSWMTKMAEDLGMVTAVLLQNPNQPIRFPNDPRDFSRKEDDIIAYCWRMFFDGGAQEPFWMLRGPMTKAAVRAMDTVTNFANSKINKFYLSGISKRGWTAWSTAAVDKRVVGVVPMVFDLLNMHPNLHHHFRSLNGWSFALEPYWSENTTLFLDSEDFPKMAAYSDPFSFIDTLTMPKYVISAGNDEYFLPDDAHYWYDQMKGPTYLRVHPNVGHNLQPRWMFISQELAAFVLSIEEKWDFPTISWTRTENATHGLITLQTDTTPDEVTAFRAETSQSVRRDFRTVSFQGGNFIPSNVMYTPINVVNTAPNEYIAVTNIPDDGWAIFFIEVTFASSKDSVIRFTSEVNIIPANKWATEDCSGTGCYGSIL